MFQQPGADVRFAAPFRQVSLFTRQTAELDGIQAFPETPVKMS